MITDPIAILHNIAELKGTSVLIIGAKSNGLVKPLKKAGFSRIDLIDIRPLEDVGCSKYSFERADIETYIPTIEYDIVICRHVLQFTKDPLKHFERILSFGKVCLIAVFGEDHEWKDLSLVPRSSLETLLRNHPELKVVYREEIHKYGITYRPGIMAYHHVLSYVTKKSD